MSGESSTVWDEYDEKSGRRDERYAVVQASKSWRVMSGI